MHTNVLLFWVVLWSIEAKIALDKVKQARKTLRLLQQRKGAKTQSELHSVEANGCMVLKSWKEGDSRLPVFGDWTQTEEKESFSYLRDRK